MWLTDQIAGVRGLCRMCSRVSGYAGTGLQPCSIQPQQISCNQPRYSAKRHYMLEITARFPGYHR
jgi:hypothetical protein